MSNKTEETLYHAIFLARHLSKGDLQDGLVYILLDLQMPSHIIGYHYIKNAILLFYSNPVHMLLNGIYQVIIDKVNPSANYEQIEQAMRSVIGQSYKNCDPKIWKIYLQQNGKRKPKRPSNYEFISQIANFMELWQACCKEASYEI